MQNRSGLDKQMRIRMGQVLQQHTPTAVEELAALISQADIGLIILFASQSCNMATASQALSRLFPGIPIIGTTTVAEIGPLGYLQGSLSALSIHREDLLFSLDIFRSISSAGMLSLQQFSFSLRETLRQRVPGMGIENSFALMLTDSRQAREERIVRAFHDGLAGIHLIGGSASDRSVSCQSGLLFNGEIVHDASILLVATTPFPFEVFKEQHFSATDQPLVVTSADPGHRTVIEFNGLPACEEYARALDLDARHLSSEMLATHPLIIKMGNSAFVRSIHHANQDGSLSFLCAVEEGAIFHPATSRDMIQSLTDTFSGVRAHLGHPALSITFDCFLRHTEMKANGHQDEIENQLIQMNAVGLSTMGEQFCGMHVNHTMTGISFGSGILA